MAHYIFSSVLSGHRCAKPLGTCSWLTWSGYWCYQPLLIGWIGRLLSHASAPAILPGTDINAVPAGEAILMAIALICAAAVFSAIARRTCGFRRSAHSVAVVALSAPAGRVIVEQISVKPSAARGRNICQRSITYNSANYGLTSDVVTYRSTAVIAQLPRNRSLRPHLPRTSGYSTRQSLARRSPSFSRGKNFYYFPDHQSTATSTAAVALRDYVVRRELNPDRLIDSQQDWINRRRTPTGLGLSLTHRPTPCAVSPLTNQNGG